MKSIFTLIFMIITIPLYAGLDSLHILGLKPYTLLYIPKSEIKIQHTDVIKIAIIDDGFNRNHRLLKNHFFINNKELFNNDIDDDLNGYIDDLQGWDFGDNDNNPFIDIQKDTSLYHGTNMVGVVINTLLQAFDTNTIEKNFKIVPLKVYRDSERQLNIKYAYEAVKYAINEKCDIIYLAWNGGKYDGELNELLLKARSEGIILITAAGNNGNNYLVSPANWNNVLSVSAVDTNFKKLFNSDYNQDVFMSGLGEHILTSYAFENQLNTFTQYTSGAAAQIVGCVSILKLLFPNLPPKLIYEGLLNTSTNIDTLNVNYAGKLGAGIPNIKNAIQYLNGKLKINTYENPKGYISIHHSQNNDTFTIQPKITASSIKLEPSKYDNNTKNTIINILNGDNVLIENTLIQNLQYKTYNNDAIKIVVSKIPKNQNIQLYFQANYIDSSRYYCKDTVYLYDEEGIIENGSGNNPYTFNNNCKWIIKVPKGKNVQIDFEYFDLEEKNDNLLFFLGAKSIPNNMMARFSGSQKPNTIVFGNNELLIWFLTNETIQKGGFKLKYSATDNPPGIIYNN